MLKAANETAEYRHSSRSPTKVAEVQEVGFRILLMILVMTLSACRPSSRLPEKRWSTEKVSTIIQLDGTPTAGITVTATPEPGAEIAYPISALTGEDGTVAFSTYESGDGLPAGKFILTFEKLKPEVQGAGKDEFNGRYGKVEKSNFKLTVAPGKQNDLPVVKLSSK